MSSSESPSDVSGERATAATERAVGRVLFWGGALSVVLIVAGLVLDAAHGDVTREALALERATEHRQSGLPAAVFVSVREVWRGVTRSPVEPVALMTLGLLALAATPAVGVAVAMVAFAAAGDRDYTVIAGIVLAALLVGVLLSGGAG